MSYIFVNSSDLLAVDYDNISQVLEVAFRSGGKYEYFDVPQNIYLGLMNASSKGSFLHRYIKNQFQYKRIA